MLKTKDALRAMRAECQARNAALPKPLPLCRDCKWPIDPADGEWLYTSRCDTCAARHLDRVLLKAARRIGRRRLKSVLKSLSK